MSENRLGTLIRNARHAKGLTQPQLGELTGIPQHYISQIERGVVKQPGLRFLEALSGPLEVCVTDMKVAMGWVVVRVEVADDEILIPVTGTVPSGLVGEGKQQAPMHEIGVSPRRLQGARGPYGLYVSTDDYRGFTILAGDVIIVEPVAGRQPSDRQLVVVELDSEQTLRRWCQRGTAVELEDANGRVTHRFQAWKDVPVQALFVTFEPLAPR